MDPDKARIDIKRALRAIVADLDGIDDRSRPWTMEIKRKLAQIGRGYGFEVCCSGFPCGPDQQTDWGEWLFDMCWLEPGPTPRRWLYKSMPFAMECEWAASVENQVFPDFQKLVFSAATLRLLIWQEDYNQLQANVNLFLDQIIASAGDPKHYLFAGFAKDRRNFEFFD